jgi:protein required for attachment to host cells
MKSRICFNFAAIVALVLAVAAIPSHATERRDPLIVVDSQQAQSARNAHHATHAKPSQKKPAAKNTQQNASTASADKSSNVSSSFEAKDQLGAEVSSGSSKSARTSAGK